MNTHRRRFLQWCAAAGVSGGGAALPARIARAQGATDRSGGSGEPEQTANVPASIRALRPMTDGIVPIADAERLGRLEKAQRLMVENNIGRTDDRDLRRVRHSTGGLPVHH
jgi:hypothetical protein